MTARARGGDCAGSGQRQRETAALSFAYNGLLRPAQPGLRNWPGTAGNNTNTLEIDGLRYATSSTGIIDVINVADIYGQTFRLLRPGHLERPEGPVPAAISLNSARSTSPTISS